MQWADFLAKEAATHGLSPEQTVAFVERLKTENSGKSEAKLASLNIGAAAFKKRMTEVYDKFAQSYPELANSESRGKLEKLRACLARKYNCGQDAHPTIKEIHHNIPSAVPYLDTMPDLSLETLLKRLEKIAFLHLKYSEK
ncbi:hypothetical protein [Komarekiella delphini-convector]|uniref:hypothetical protein n=1 Tax=Komarekiella delphini-convector TaxID=3050158 RepID=UPI001782784C|nr:hypothetical protein [Komarekiella delphini-convector]